jgi:predicted enzyme related to lactoylglutathione lyase
MGGPSRFVWYELHTPDAAAAARFYEPVLGWTTRDAGAPNRKYTLTWEPLASTRSLRSATSPSAA